MYYIYAKDALANKIKDMKKSLKEKCLTRTFRRTSHMT